MNHLRISVALLYLLSILLTPLSASADRAEKILGVKDIHPPIRRAIDEGVHNEQIGKAPAGGMPGFGMGGSAKKTDDDLPALNLNVPRVPIKAPKLDVEAKASTKDRLTHTLNKAHLDVQEALKGAGVNLKDPKVKSQLSKFDTAKAILRKIPKKHFDVSDPKKLLSKLEVSDKTDSAKIKAPGVDVHKPEVPAESKIKKPALDPNRVSHATIGKPHVKLPHTGGSRAFDPTYRMPDQKMPDQHMDPAHDVPGQHGTDVPGSHPGRPDPSSKKVDPSVPAPDSNRFVPGTPGNPEIPGQPGSGPGSDSPAGKFPGPDGGLPSSPKFDPNSNLPGQPGAPDSDPSGLPDPGSFGPSGLPSGMPDINNQINQAMNEVPTKDGIRKRIGQVGGLPTKDGYDQIKDKVAIDVDNKMKNIDRKKISEDVSKRVNEGDIEKKISNAYQVKLAVRLGDVRKKVVDATDHAYNGVLGWLGKEVNEKRDHYHHVDTWWNDVFHHSRVTTARKVYHKYQDAYNKVYGDKYKSIGKINAAFADAGAKLVSSNDGAPPTISDEDSTPHDPPEQQELTPQNGADHRRIDIKDEFQITAIAPGDIVASIGDLSRAVGEIATVGSLDDTTIGSGKETVTAAATVSVSIGYETLSELRIGTIDGNIGGSVNRTITTPGVISAAIGGSSSSTVEIGTITGDIVGNAHQIVTAGGATAVSIGGDSTAIVRVGAIDPPGSIGSLDQVITSVGPIAAAIGYDSTAEVSSGYVHADVSGNLKQVITTGPLISASVGSHTDAYVSVGEIAAPVSGTVDQTITVGAVTSASIGAGTIARNEVGAVHAPIFGSLKSNIIVGDMIAASVGVGTLAEARVGSIRAPVHGNLTQDITVGNLTNLAIGIGTGSGHAISSQTFIGTVNEPVYGSRNITVHVGSIFALGFGLDLDLGPFGHLRLYESDCEGGSVSLGNIGNPC